MARLTYIDGKRDMAKAMGYDAIAHCWHCEQHVAVHCMDATCKCGAPFDSSRCEEFKFYPNKKIKRGGA